MFRLPTTDRVSVRLIELIEVVYVTSKSIQVINFNLAFVVMNFKNPITFGSDFENLYWYFGNKRVVAASIDSLHGNI
jgi:hypothetical protein